MKIRALIHLIALLRESEYIYNSRTTCWAIDNKTQTEPNHINDLILKFGENPSKTKYFQKHANMHYIHL